MRNLLCADFYRMYRTKGLALCTLFMLVTAGGFVLIQRTAMDYTVSLDRVLFLPMSLYGVAVAALIGMFSGADLHDGGIRRKLIAGVQRRAVYASEWAACCLGCVTVYLVTVAVTLVSGCILFPVNVTAGEIAAYTTLGLFMCLAYGSIFTMVSILAGNRNTAVLLCMLLSFCMLFLCLHTNQILAQPTYKEGALNPAYVDGVKRIMYLLLHDLNPSGQAAQLSAMQCLDTARFIAMDLLWIVVSCGIGGFIFSKQEIR